jgi:hypothetical protein
MKKLTQILSLFALAMVFVMTSGCASRYAPRYGRRYIPYGPEVGSPEWIYWVDHRVDTRYANGVRPDPGSQEWYAMVDHVVFADYSRDYYRAYRRNAFAYPDRNYDPTDISNDSDRRYTIDRRYAGDSYSRDRRYSSVPRGSDERTSDTGTGRTSYKDTRPLEPYRYRQPVRFREGCVPVDDRPYYCVGSMEWKRAVDAALGSGRVPIPPPRSDPWDAPLAPTH